MTPVTPASVGQPATPAEAAEGGIGVAAAIGRTPSAAALPSDAKSEAGDKADFAARSGATPHTALPESFTVAPLPLASMPSAVPGDQVASGPVPALPGRAPATSSDRHDAAATAAAVAPASDALPAAIAAGVTAPETVRALVPDNLPGGALPADPSVAAAVDAGGASPALAPAAPHAQSPGATLALPPLLGSLSQRPLSLTLGLQSARDAGGGVFGGDDRGRYAPLSATSEAGNVAAATTLGGPGEIAALASPAAAPAIAATPTAAGTISDQVAGQLVRLISSGSRDMVMRLHPPELGDLTVRVAVSGRDVSAWFASPQSQVQSAISAALGQLQTNLGDAGYNLSGAWVGADASSAHQQRTNPPAPLPPRIPVTASPVGLSAPTASRPSVSGLNLYV
jgi:hypothetical protein